MWFLFKQPIEKHYYSKNLSRSWLLSVACCLFAFIVPLLMLISIGYSWDVYQLAFYQPVIQYQNYQASCLLNTGSLVYDSSFSNQLGAKSYQSFVSAGGEGKDLVVSANFIASDVYACTMLVYFKVKINDKLPTIAVLPLQFYKQTTNAGLFMSTVVETGTIEAKLTYSVPQSSVDSGSGLQYFTNGSQSLSMINAHQSYATDKNISLVPSIKSSQIGYATTAAGVTYEGRFAVQTSEYIEQTSLLQNIRTFIPFYIYLIILAWFFLAQPTVRWMLENKIYRSKVMHHKIKTH